MVVPGCQGSEATHGIRGWNNGFAVRPGQSRPVLADGCGRRRAGGGGGEEARQGGMSLNLVVGPDREERVQSMHSNRQRGEMSCRPHSGSRREIHRTRPASAAGISVKKRGWWKCAGRGQGNGKQRRRIDVGVVSWLSCCESSSARWMLLLQFPEAPRRAVSVPSLPL